MKIFLILHLLLSTFHSFGQSIPDCPLVLKVKLENEKSIYFCEFNTKMISHDCYLQKEKCPMLLDLKKYQDKMNSLKNKNLDVSPGTEQCNLLEGKVVMGRLYGDSEICLCAHSSGAKITCKSLIP